MLYEYEFIRHIESTCFKFFFVSMVHRNYHWHSDIEILFVVDGSVTLDTADKSFKLSKNDIFLLNSNEVHSLTKTSEANTILTIQFDPKFCSSYFPQLQRIIFPKPFITKTANEVCFYSLKNYLSQMVIEYYKKEPYFQLKLMSNLNLMICSLLENLEYKDITEKAVSTHAKNLDRLNHVILYVKENYMNKISLKNIAEKENLDMYYLSHFVKKYLGISFQEYLNKVRLEKALELLIQTNRTKLDICIECGFSDYRYLNKMFLKEFNCTPAEYKRQYSIQGSKFSVLDNDLQQELIHSEMALKSLIKYLDK